MKKIILAAMAAVLFVGMTSAVAYTVVQYPEKEKNDKGTISLNTNASKEVQPDVADLTIIIMTKDKKSLQEAMDQNKETSGKIYTALKAMINTSKDDYIKTTNFNASPDYVYNKDGKATIKGYTVSNNILIHTKELEKVGKMIDTAIEMGAISIGNLTVSVSDYTGVCNELMSIASKTAYTQASSVVKNSASEILGIKSIDARCTGNHTVVPRQSNYAKMADMVVAEEAYMEKPVTIIEHGAINVQSYVNAVYYVK